MISDPILMATDLTKTFGGLMALSRISFSVAEKTVTALIGPNGAGKTTCLNVISGVYPLNHGEIVFNRLKVTGLRPFRLAHLGLTRSFQNLQVFENMTVLENVMVGLHTRTSTGFLEAMIRTPKVRAEERTARGEAMAALDFLGLADKAHLDASSLSYGDQKRVEMARALVSRPRLVLLDEPVAGLNPRETEDMGRMIEDLRGQGLSILLVEHDMNLVMGISDWVIVLNYGEKIAEGPPRQVQDDHRVIAAYLGTDDDA